MAMITKRIAVVLLSGGIDSTTCLYFANSAYPKYEEVHGVSLNYGQRHIKEIGFALMSCKALGIDHHILEVPDIFPKSMLTDEGTEVPDISYAQIEGVSPTYVPFRNGTMLTLLTAFTTGLLDRPKATPQGISRDASRATLEADIYFGAHSEDAANWAYPDCTPEFIGAMANAIYIGTYRRVRLVTPLQWLDKQDIIEKGTSLGVDWSKTWSCYKGEKYHCGTCPTCRSRREAFEKTGITDPTHYNADPV